MKTMAEVIMRAMGCDRRAHYGNVEQPFCGKHGHYGQWPCPDAVTVADALTAAGFGPVKTIAELAAIERAGMVWALRDAAKEAEYELDLVDEPKENAPSSWLRARAATMDNPAEKLRKP